MTRNLRNMPRLLLQEWGVDLGEHEKPNRATRSYLNYVHGIANDPSEVRRRACKARAKHTKQECPEHGLCCWCVCCWSFMETFG